MSLDFTSEAHFRNQVRVAYLTNTLGPHSLPFCEYLSKMLPNFRVFLSAEVDDFHGFPRDWGNVQVTVLRSFNQVRIRRKAYGFWQSGELHIPYDTYHQLKAFRPDVILANQLGIRTMLATVYARRHPEVKIILCATLSDHSERQRSWPRRVLRKWLIQYFHAAFINGQGSETYLRRLGFSKPTFAIPYTVRAERFEAPSYDAEPPHFNLLYAGMLIPQKGLLPFTEVLRRWCQDHPDVSVRFTLVGDGVEAGKLQVLVLPSNLQLQFLPKMPQDQLARQYWAADLFAFPTLGDEWGVVINEAMIAGRPILGSIHSQAVTELVKPGESGWLYDPHKPASIYAALDQAFSRSVEQLAVMSQQAREAIRALTPERMARRAVEAISSISRS